jgi:hypothetical protein
MPFGCSGGFQLTKIESPDITRAFIALGASGTAKIMSVMSAEARKINNDHEQICICYHLKNGGSLYNQA